ncbi:glycosyltransferase family 2 protein [Lacticaseibacillus nasuensis]|uniref:Glycosyltransferase 2-like domain-containing protein n=1 Tax=Lacticaseibacillus nasuensis JCM 17158 TaxID=1291734 RepID=A0A0R1JVC2_9LACO|nr:glycosyltransferase family A protein [Lacticaseibacillus nasuensis]KRK72649.1 hypothetical protein FD02_GL001622 [Lacticaseibacillus nasuensis JCM 17158]
MKLTVIIPWRDESPGQLYRLLSSIDAQLEIDFAQLEVVVVADGPAVWPQRISVAMQHFTPISLRSPGNVGAGLARQYGIDHSTGDYLMFLDGDDVLQDVFALSRFWRAGAHDLIVGPYTKESYASGYQYQQSDAIESSAVYAKWYRRSYLTSIGLRFSPELRTYEDAYFVTLALLLTTDVAVLTQPSYVWLRNMQSLGRRDHFAMAHQADQWAKSYRLRLAFLASHDSPDYAHQGWSYVVKAFFHIQIYTPADVHAFLQEHRRILTAIGQHCQPITPAELVAQAERLQPKLYPTLTMNGFAKYAADQLAIIRQVPRSEEK